MSYVISRRSSVLKFSHRMIWVKENEKSHKFENAYVDQIKKKSPAYSSHKSNRKIEPNTINGLGGNLLTTQRRSTDDGQSTQSH